MSQDEECAAHGRLLRGENGVPGLLERVSHCEEMTDRIEDRLDRWDTTAKTVGVIVVSITLAVVNP